MGDYFWIQLTECRHFGAFESAAITFEDLCKRLWLISIENFSNNDISPTRWLFQALDALTQKNGTLLFINIKIELDSSFNL